VSYKYFLPIICRHFLKKVYKNILFCGSSWLLFTHISNFFNKIFSSNIKFNLRFIDGEQLNSLNIEKLMQKLLLYNSSISKYYFLKEICEIFFLIGLSKDSNMLLDWIIRNLSFIFFKKHWSFLNFLKVIIYYIFDILQYKFNLRGILIIFRGKIGQIGSVRKKSYFIKYGKYSYSDLNLRPNFSSSVVKTDTGVIGVSVSIYY
jgi:hypothetical protein